MTLPSPEERADLVRRLRHLETHPHLDHNERRWATWGADLIEALDAALTAEASRRQTAERALKHADKLFGRIASQTPQWQFYRGNPPASTGHMLYVAMANYEKSRERHRARLSDGADATTPEESDVRLP